MKPSVYAIGTMDTKSQELAYLAKCLRTAGANVTMVDVSTSKNWHAAEIGLTPGMTSPDIDRNMVLAGELFDGNHDRGTAIRVMSQALSRFLVKEFAAGRVAGVIGLGGSGGTALITSAMRALPIGLPKLMVSTVASGNTAGYVDCSDITMMYSVVDVAGLNVVSRTVLGNAAHAMAGMVANTPPTAASRPAIGMTMFGVTTPCVTAIRETLETRGYDCLVFHATGTGGRAMERLVESGLIGGVLDMTTTEVADEIAGGIFPSGQHRFERLLNAEIPLVMSLGALDMVNFGALETVPPNYRHRQLHIHNDQITLMRTNVDENRLIARWIAAKLNRSTAPVTMLIPEQGVSMLDKAGCAFENPDANAALFGELEATIVQTDTRRLIRLPYHINDSEFSSSAVQHFTELTNQSNNGKSW